MSSIIYQLDGPIEHEIDYEDKIKQIDLRYSEIQKIIKINGMEDLMYLNLSVNRINIIGGLERLTVLQHLDLSGNLITHIGGLEQLKSLQRLDLSGNRITHIGGLEQLTGLQCLDLSDNQISRIEGLDKQSDLKELHLGGNHISRIEGLNNMRVLRRLTLHMNKITRIEGLDNLTALRRLYLLCNQITHIEGVDKLSSLQQLHLSFNHITEIKGLDNLRSLQMLLMYCNPIKKIPLTIMLLENLSTFDVDIKCDPIIERFLSRNRIKLEQTIYDDPQNVHDTQINRSICQSLYRLLEQKSELSEEKVIDDIISDRILTNMVKQHIVEYIRMTDVHSLLCITFSEAFRAVWQIIRTHRESDEIKRILNQEIDDSYCRCFTGRLSRLVNCLNGFDPRVSIRISDKQEIANMIISIRQKTDILAEQTEMVLREMSKRGYDDETINEWIGYLE
jgi:hypothetical protein